MSLFQCPCLTAVCVHLLYCSVNLLSCILFIYAAFILSVSQSFLFTFDDNCALINTQRICHVADVAFELVLGDTDIVSVNVFYSISLLTYLKHG